MLYYVKDKMNQINIPNRDKFLKFLKLFFFFWFENHEFAFADSDR